jgi:anti-anti-sigma factor
VYHTPIGASRSAPYPSIRGLAIRKEILCDILQIDFKSRFIHSGEGEREMEITTSQLKTRRCCESSRRIDSHTAPQLEEVIENIIQQGRFKIVVDMTEVDFISSKGWWVLIETQKAVSDITEERFYW